MRLRVEQIKACALHEKAAGSNFVLFSALIATFSQFLIGKKDRWRGYERRTTLLEFLFLVLALTVLAPHFI